MNELFGVSGSKFTIWWKMTANLSRQALEGISKPAYIRREALVWSAKIINPDGGSAEKLLHHGTATKRVLKTSLLKKR